MKNLKNKLKNNLGNNITNGMTQETLVLFQHAREQFMDRVDVLEKVKRLPLLPNLEMATTQQVADFYEVGLPTITSLYQRNKDELLSDGMETVTGQSLKERLVAHKMYNVKIENKPGYFAVETSEGFVKLAHRSNKLFPRRAILRIGMLLRNSEVAKEVRKHLLKVEETVVDMKPTVLTEKKDLVFIENNEVVTDSKKWLRFSESVMIMF
ncbi:hypothetical protein [Bacillus manliponensis]|uniref:hypothetical protein n=1 Tax=Bacillus manliponensis TaxID=574376 RepID=UPI0035139AD5